jgi:hypothetical protein
VEKILEASVTWNISESVSVLMCEVCSHKEIYHRWIEIVDDSENTERFLEKCVGANEIQAKLDSNF